MVCFSVYVLLNFEGSSKMYVRKMADIKVISGLNVLKWKGASYKVHVLAVHKQEALLQNLSRNANFGFPKVKLLRCSQSCIPQHYERQYEVDQLLEKSRTSPVDLNLDMAISLPSTFENSEQTPCTYYDEFLQAPCASSSTAFQTSSISYNSDMKTAGTHNTDVDISHDMEVESYIYMNLDTMQVNRDSTYNMASCSSSSNYSYNNCDQTLATSHNAAVDADNDNLCTIEVSSGLTYDSLGAPCISSNNTLQESPNHNNSDNTLTTSHSIDICTGTDMDIDIESPVCRAKRKQHCCLYCGLMTVTLVRHLIRKHKQEEEVKQAMYYDISKYY